MDISVVDTSAVRGDSFLHRTAPATKLLAFALVLLAVVVTWNVLVALALALSLASLALACRLPARQVFALAAYPALFAALFAFASAPDWLTGAVIVLKAVTAALAAVIVVFTTPYPQVFAALQKVTPSLVGDALLMTYRSLFIMLGKFADLRRAVRLRSAGARGPVASVRATARALAGLLLYSLDLAQHDYDVLRVRGYEGRLSVTLPRAESPSRDAALVASAGALLAVSATWRIAASDLNPYSWLPAAAALLALPAAVLVGRRGR